MEYPRYLNRGVNNIKDFYYYVKMNGVMINWR